MPSQQMSKLKFFFTSWGVGVGGQPRQCPSWTMSKSDNVQVKIVFLLAGGGVIWTMSKSDNVQAGQ